MSLDVPPIGNEWDPKGVATVGEFLLDITYQLAQE